MINISFSFWIFTEKLAEAQRRFATLQNELQTSLDAQRESNAPGLRSRRKTVLPLSNKERNKHRNIKDLQLAFSEFYLSLILLQNYQVWNLSCFCCCSSPLLNVDLFLTGSVDALFIFLLFSVDETTARALKAQHMLLFSAGFFIHFIFIPVHFTNVIHISIFFFAHISWSFHQFGNGWLNLCFSWF